MPKIGLWQSPSCQVLFSAGRNAIIKATEYETFIFFFFSDTVTHGMKSTNFQSGYLFMLLKWEMKRMNSENTVITLITKHIVEKLFYSTNGTIWPNYNLAEKINKMLHEKF